MAQCVEKADKRPADLAAKDVIEIDDFQPKKLKQARLPFQPLDCKTPSPSPAGANSKKRKLSGQDSPNSKSKHARHGSSNLSQSAEKDKLPTLNNEVSSSSEAENLPGSSKPTKNNILERFVRRSSLQEEITSTNDVIDLTNSQGMASEQDENSPVKLRSPTKSAKKIGGESVEKSDSKKQKPEDWFARKLNFDEKTPPAILQGCPSEETSGEAAKEVDVLVDEEMKSVDETQPIDNDKRDEEPALIDLSQEDEEVICNDTFVLEEKSEDKSVVDVSSPDKSESENRSCDTSSVKKKRPLSSSTPHTPANANISCSSADGSTPNSTRKRGRVSTGKQVQKAEMRQKVVEDKERQKLEAKERKEKERLEQKQKREAEKAEKLRQKQEEKEMKEKERLEKKDQLEKEKQEKLKKRDEEKKQKQELLDAKQEEKKKKEEEKRLKEEGKQKEDEEKERQKLKRKEAFESFFLKPKAVTTTKVPKVTNSLFIPFEVKKDMSLAPGRRRSSLTDQEKDRLDKALAGEGQDMMYVDCLKKAIVKPVRTGRKLRTKKEAEQEVELMVHDSETVKKVMHTVKLLQFHTDNRPPYYGTWRKAPKHISPRNPWKKDEVIFDYEVDSDEEWEEEEPGESLSDSNDEDEEGDGGGEEEEDDGWMVPHGYLSEDEGCEDDEEVTPEVLKARQRAKAQAWEVELQAKKQVAPPVHIGCYWHSISTFCQKDIDILRQFEMVCLRAIPLQTQLSCPTLSDPSGDKSQDKTRDGATPSAKGSRKRAVPEEAMPDLIRLLHGNSFGIKKLVREFHLYWRRKTTGVNVSLNESHLDEEEAMDTSCVDTSIVQTQEEVASAEGEKGVVGSHSKEAPKQSESEEKQVADKPGDVKKQEADKSEDGKDDSEADDNFSISKRQLELKILAIAAREKRPGINKKCWYVSDEALQQHSMTNISTENTWEYVSHDMNRKTPCKSAEKKKEKKAAVINSDAKVDAENDAENQVDKPKKIVVPKAPKDQPSIMGFTCKAPLEKTEGNMPAPQSVEYSASKSGQKSNTPSKAATKPDKPSVLDLLKKTPAKKASSSLEDTTKNLSKNKTKNPSGSKTESSMEEDCIVLD